jgi:hypothetical protein
MKPEKMTLSPKHVLETFGVSVPRRVLIVAEIEAAPEILAAQ